MSEAYREVFDCKTGEVRREAVPIAQRRKPWANKTWSQMTDDDKHMLRAHFETFENTEEGQEKLIGYKKYLHHWCQVPCDWLGINLICG